MLILTRRFNESLCIYPQEDEEDLSKITTIKFLGFTFNAIKLGIEAPENTKIYREEVYRRILQEKNMFLGN